MLNRLYGWYGKRVVRVVFGLIIVLIIVGIYMYKHSSGAAVVTPAISLPEVTLSTVHDLVSKTSFSVTGTVRSLSEAELQAEAGGRVTSVAKSIGDSVYAGEVIATIENSQEHAQLLQAEGAYESALAGSQSSGVSLSEAKVSVRNTYRETYATADNILHTVVNDFFSNPGGSVSGFKLGGTGESLTFIAERDSLDQSLQTWSNNLQNPNTQLSESDMLSFAEKTVSSLNELTTSIFQVVSDKDNKTGLTDAEIAADQTRLTAARSALDATLGSISRTRQSFDQATVAGASNGASQSDAQQKSALGILRNAQANYEKTIVRAPISGVINALYLTEGAYASVGAPAVRIANNGALEISTALGEKDLGGVKIGDTVRINDTIDGTVTKIAPAVDPTTGKAEVKIAVSKDVILKNGTTASVTFTNHTASTDDGKIIIPLTTIKLLPSGPVVFTVNDAKVLVSQSVELGAITGDAVEITKGLTSSSAIVSDARGLKAGDTVTVTTK